MLRSIWLTQWRLHFQYKKDSDLNMPQAIPLFVAAPRQLTGVLLKEKFNDSDVQKWRSFTKRIE